MAMCTVSEQRRVNGISGITYILDIMERNDTNRPFYTVYNLFGKRIIGYLRRAGLTIIFFFFLLSVSLSFSLFLSFTTCIYCVFLCIPIYYFENCHLFNV